MTYEQQFSALAHPLRQRILTSLGTAPKSVRELTQDFDATQPAISQHLKVLRDAGFVEVTPVGARNIYSARPERLEELRRFLEQHWHAMLSSLDDNNEDPTP